MSSPVPDRRTPEFRNVTAETFRTEILPTAKPAILRGFTAHWPAVEAGRRSPEALAAHIRSFDSGAPVRFAEAHPAVKGRFFYNDDLTGVNFTQHDATVGAVLDRLLALMDEDAPPAVAVQSVPEPQALPGFARANPSPLLGEDVYPRLWIGNAATVHTHHDMNDNIACAVAGRRRFILFPPDQTRNLYIGPFERTPAGPPISMVSVVEPDLERHPRFTEAWAVAEVADLEPGDALFIPYMWWHHVQSLDRFSVLVNYWWNDARLQAGPLEAMIHAMLGIRDLPPSQRETWRAMFDAFVFEADDPPGAHLPEDKRGVQGRLSPAAAAQMRQILARTLAN
ncbi:cupin-like domain-containing protein [Brevundimonas sp.]|uniref:cupin-like domain-containing protein n=1 Tax=Brevundimonas sp. TaxID=1871086 RepID=UPI003918C9FF